MPKEGKKQGYLRFGQIIRIHGHKCLQIQGDKEEIRGMITVKGFTDKDAKYTTFQYFTNCNFYRQSLFQILPKGGFQRVETNDQKQRQKKNYQQLVASKMGEFLKYGEDVVFQHVDSHDYLSGSVRCSDGGLGAFKVELSSLLTQDLVFKLEPFRSFEKQGDLIKLESPLRIKNISNRCYISTEKNNLDKYNIVTTYSRSFTWLIHLHQSHETLDDRDTVRTHDLLFLIHTKNQGYLCLEKPKKIFKQNDHESRLPNKKSQQPQLQPLIQLPLKETGFPFFTSIWQIQKHTIRQISPFNEGADFKKLGTDGTYTLRQLLYGVYLSIKQISGDVGNTIEDKPNQDNIDDKQLPPEIQQITIKSAKGLTNISQFLKDKGLIKIGGAKILSQGEIDAGQEMIIDKSTLRIREQHPYMINYIRFTQAESEHGFRIMKLDEQSKNQVLFILSTYQVLDNFILILLKTTEEFEIKVKSKELQHIDVTLQKLVAFIKNCDITQIQGQLLPIKKIQCICMDLEICDKLFQIVKQIGKKIQEEIYKTKKGENQALKTVFNRAYYLIWQIIKNNPITKNYVCQYWLEDIIINHAIQLQEDTVHNTLKQILQNNDQVVTKFLNKDDNHLVKRIINIFNLKPPHQKFLSIFSASCVSGNLPIVGNQNLIRSQFLSYLDQKSRFKFRYQLSNEVVDGDEDILRPMKAKVKKVQIQSYISKDHLDTRELKRFFDDSGKIDLFQTSNYFIAYLNLLADICYGKNTSASEYIEQILKPERIVNSFEEDIQPMVQPGILDILVTILQDPQMNSSGTIGFINLQRAILRLITFAYIQSASQNPVLRINRYRNIDQMSSNVIQKKEKFYDILQFIKKELMNFKSFYNEGGMNDYLDKKQREARSLQVKMRLYTILDLLKSTLTNGYWSVQQQQNDILPLLLNILKNDKSDILHQKEQIDNIQQLKEQFKKFKNQVSLATPGIEKIIQCKALACQLIEIIFDFRFNNLVTESVAFYKDLEEEKRDNIRQFHKISIDIAKLKSDAQTYLLYNPQLWQQKLAKILDKQGPENEKLRNAIYFLIPLMVQLSIHRDSRLFFRSLKILKRHFHLSTDIKNLLLSLSLYDNRNGQYLAQQVIQKRKKLNKLQEESLLYSTNPQNPYQQIKDFLVWLSEAIKVGSDLRAKLESDEYYSIFQHFNEESRIDKFHQRLIKNKDLHPILLKFIGLSKQPLSSFSTYAKQILKYVYRFLTLLARNFKEAKKQMIHILQKIKFHVRQQANSMISISSNSDLLNERTISYANIGIYNTQVLKVLRERNDCEAILLLSQLFIDNKDIIYNENLMSDITAEIADMINKVAILWYYKSHLLDFLRSLIYYKDKNISINQSKILGQLQDSKKVAIFYMFDKLDRTPLLGESAKSDQPKLYLRNIGLLIQQWMNHNKQLLNIAKPQYDWPLKRGQTAPIIILQQLTYFITMMNLLSNLVEGQQSVNIGKCRQVHSYSMLMDILGNSSICYPLKAHLRNYVNELYYSTSIEDDLCIDIIKLELPVLINDLNTLIIILSKQREGRYYILHPIRYKFFESYIYLYIEQIAYSINYLINDATFVKEIRKQLDSNYAKSKYYLHYYVLRVYERLRWILNYYYGHKYLRGFLNKITNKMKDIFLLYFKQSAFVIFDKSEEKLHAPQGENKDDNQPKKESKKKAMSQNRIDALKKRSTKLVHKLVEAQIGNYFTQERPQKQKNFPLVFFLPYDEDSQTPAQKQMSNVQKQLNQKKIAQKLRVMLFSKEQLKKRVDYHSLKLSKLSNKLHSKDSFNMFMKSFIEKACKQLYEVDDFSENHYHFKDKFVSFQQYIRIFVDVNTSSPSQIPTELKIFFFSTLLQFIVRDHQGENLKEIQNWNKNDFQFMKQKVRKAQLFLLQSNVAQLLVQTLKYTEDLNLIYGILQFGIGYLLGGNTECQNSLLQKVKQDKKNELFRKIQAIISKLGRKISSKIAQVTATIIPRSDQFVVQALDRYDYYQPNTKSLKRFGNFQEEKDQVDEQKLEKKVFTCLFKFMQLLCQCNNIDFKNFIREQIDMDGQRKNATRNILNMTTFQIRRFFKVMDREASVIVLPLTDFLNEVVTLPCSLNQLSLCETTFFEDLCYMSGFFTEKANLKERGFDTPQSLERLFELYQKCILVILNILEGNDQELNKSFLNKLDVSFLLRLIQKYFQLLNLQTEEDLHSLLHDKDKQQKHVPVELENAINVMIVLLKLQASEGAENFIEKKRIYMIEAEKGRGFNIEKLLNGLKKEILKIEIVSTLGKQYIYFPKHPILTKLSDATRNRIMQQVSRSTQREKIKSLLQFKDQIFTEINHNFSIQKQKFIGIQISPAKIQQLQDYLFKLSYFIILIWFTTANAIIEYQQVDYVEPPLIRWILLILDVTQLLITLLYSILYFKIKFVLANYRAKKKSQQDQYEQLRKKQLSMDQPDQTAKDTPQNASRFTLGSVLQKIGNKISNNKLIILFGNDEKFSNVVLYFVSSLMGTVYDQKLFMLYILYYFMKNQTLENVFKAITFNITQLGSVGILGVVFVYVFCLIFYETYALQLFQSSDPKDMCQGILPCILDLYVSGTIGGSVDQLKLMRFLTDMIYFVFFGLLFENIVSGIMIDTFAQRRAKREEMYDDKKNKCYICGRNRGQLQKNNEQFDNHIHEKHFLWNYIYYLYCLFNKNQTEYTGLEYEIRVCVDAGQNEEDYIKWIPFGGEENDPHVEKVNELNDFMEKLNLETQKRVRSIGNLSQIASQDKQQSK